MEAMYQEQHVRENARRLRLSWIRWATIIATISGGSLVAGDGGVGEILLEASAERVPRIRYETRLIRSSITAAGIMVGRSSEGWAAYLPDNEDVRVFGCGIAISPLEVQVRRDLRGKTGFDFHLGSEFETLMGRCW